MNRKIIATVFMLLAVWFMLPICSGILHIGMIYPALILIFLAAVLLMWEKVKNFAVEHKIIFRGLCFVFVIGMAVIIVPLVFMVSSVLNAPPENATVIVLGCKVNGETPSKMLYDRSLSALEYLNENPEAVCIASGGQGKGEDISEAQAIYNILTQNGISPDRIYLEDKSTTTAENMEYSAEIIAKNGLSSNVAIASDNFHQFRAGIFAEKNGLSAYSVGCATYPYVSLGYWAREVLAVYKAVLLGY